MNYEGENTLREFSRTKIDEIEKRLDGLKGKLNDGTRKLLKMTDADVRYMHTADPSMFMSDEKAKAVVDTAKFERQRVFLFSDMIVFAAKKKVAGVSTRNLIFRGRIFVHEMRLRNAPAGTDHRERTLTYMRQTVDGADNYTVVFASPSDKEEWWMGLDDVINEAKRDMVFGLKLHELMTGKQSEIGRDVPTFLVQTISFIEKHGLETEGIYRISGSSTDIEDARARFNKGLTCEFNEGEVHLVSGLLKLWLRDLREPLCTSGLFDLFIDTISEDGDAKPDAVTELKRIVEMLPQYERFALHELMMHLARVASHSAQNNMDADNLAIVIGPNVLKSPDMSSVHVHNTFKRIFKVIELLIRNVDTVFADVPEQRRALVEAARTELEREKAQYEKVKKETELANPDDAAQLAASVPASAVFGGGTGGKSADLPVVDRLVLQWSAALAMCNVRKDESHAALRAILERAKPSDVEYEAIRGALAVLAHAAASGSSNAASSSAMRSPEHMRQTKGVRSVGEHDFVGSSATTRGGMMSGSSRSNLSSGSKSSRLANHSSSSSSSPPLPAAAPRGMRRGTSSGVTSPASGAHSARDAVSPRSPTASLSTSPRSERAGSLKRALSGGRAGDNKMPADWNVRALPGLRSKPPPNRPPPSKPPAVSPRQSAAGESAAADAAGLGARRLSASSPVVSPRTGDSDAAAAAAASSGDATDDKIDDKNNDDDFSSSDSDAPPPLPPMSSPPVSPGTPTPTRKPKSGKSQSERKSSKTCESCEKRKAKHRVTLTGGKKKLLCVDCVSKFPSATKSTRR